ncbi:MAG: HlyD family efflux transporter periplasmic adaptor subunit [Clostridiaceae bacterium]|nr:HlyD family efflux transporter periplasmic adaptor subunit [Clostridiaceae bacterium]
MALEFNLQELKGSNMEDKMNVVINGMIQPTRKKILRRTIYIFVAVLLLLTFLSSTINNLGLIRVVAADVGSGRLSYDFENDVIVTPQQIEEIYLNRALKVDSIKVEKGDIVSKGQLLAEFDVDELSKDLSLKVSELESKKVETNLAVNVSSLAIKNAVEKTAAAQKAHDDAIELYEAGAETAANIEKMKIALEDAKSEYEKLQAEKAATAAKAHIELKQLEESILSLQTDINRLKALYSPVDGYIWEIGINRGATTDTAKPVFKIADNSRGFHAEFTVKTQEGKHLVVGDSVTVRIPSLENVKMDAKISSIDLVRADTGNALKINLIFDRADLKGGELAETSIKKSSGIYNLIIPNAAIRVDTNGRKYAYVIKERKSSIGKEYYLQKAFIYVSASDNVNTAISDGLKPFEKVVIESSSTVMAGDRVKIQRD